MNEYAVFGRIHNFEIYYIVYLLKRRKK